MNDLKQPDQDEDFLIEYLEDGSYVFLIPFLGSILNEYPEKTDYRDFTHDERVEMALNIYHFMKIFEDQDE